MVKAEAAREMALALPGTDEHPHFDRLAFRVNKKIFATLDIAGNRVMVKLPEAEQSVYCLIDKAVIYPVPGGWGRKGATYIDLGKVKKPILRDALLCAYHHAAAPVRGVQQAKKGKR